MYARDVSSSVFVTLIYSIAMADDKSRVCLTEIPDKHGSDYINASFIDVRIIHVIQKGYFMFGSRDTLEDKPTLQHKVSLQLYKLSCVFIHVENGRSTERDST